MRCSQCNKFITPLNRFYRKHGKAMAYYPETGEVEEGFIFCSEKCADKAMKGEVLYK